MFEKSLRTTKELNEQNKQFWDKHHEIFKDRMQDGGLVAIAFETLRYEKLKQIPVYFQTTLEKALEQAQENNRSFLRWQATKGGKAAKRDALMELILEIISKKRTITRDELYNELVARHMQGVIEDIDDDIINFKNHNGKTKSAKTNGLKHRLTRAKKTLISQTG